MWAKAVIVWIGMAALAVMNGVVRNSAIAPRLGEPAGHVLSSVILCLVIFGVAWLTNPWLRPGTVRTGYAVGLLWVSLTVAFEFLAGHYLFGNPWEKLLADYNLARGRVWVLVLLATLTAPGWAENVRVRTARAA